MPFYTLQQVFLQQFSIWPRCKIHQRLRPRQPGQFFHCIRAAIPMVLTIVDLDPQHRGRDYRVDTQYPAFSSALHHGDYVIIAPARRLKGTSLSWVDGGEIYICWVVVLVTVHWQSKELRDLCIWYDMHFEDFEDVGYFWKNIC